MVEHDEPEQVWGVGRGVGKALREHGAIRDDRIISQPQDRNRDRYERGLEKLIHAFLA
jgi:hypothetical protein